MKIFNRKDGFTLIEMLLVVAIIVLLVSMVIGVAKRVDDQGKERLCRETITLIGNALEQFRDFDYEYKHGDFAGLVFPLDCNDFLVADLELILRKALYPVALPITVGISQSEPIHDPNYSGSEALYFILNQVPDCRTALGKIDKSLLASNGKNGAPMNITITSGTIISTYPLMRIIDPWKTPLRYDYYPDYADYIIDYPTNTWFQYIGYRGSNKLTFPVITSAGADKKFDTDDDITNR